MQKYVDALTAKGWRVETLGRVLRITVAPRRIVRLRFWDDGSHADPFSRHAAEREMVADTIKAIE